MLKHARRASQSLCTQTHEALTLAAYTRARFIRLLAFTDLDMEQLVSYMTFCKCANSYICCVL